MLEKYSKKSPSALNPMSWSFAFSKPSHIIATFLGSGVLRPASGTFGTLAGLLFYLALSPFLGTIFWIAAIVVAFFVGAWACEVTGRDIKVHDHSSIVIDEVFAIWGVLLTVPDNIYWQIAAFIAFRFFDIIKLPPAAWVDQNVHSGYGVMLDDAVAAIQAILVLGIIQLIF